MSTYVTTEELQKAYLAGLFDGEGCINLVEQKTGNSALHASIAQKNWPLLESLRQKFGGCLCRTTSAGCWQLQLTHKTSVKAFLQYLLPYLVIRYKEADIAVKLCDYIPDIGRKQALQDKVVRFRLEQLLENAATIRDTGFTEAIQ